MATLSSLVLSLKRRILAWVEAAVWNSALTARQRHRVATLASKGLGNEVATIRVLVEALVRFKPQGEEREEVLYELDVASEVALVEMWVLLTALTGRPVEATRRDQVIP